MHTCREITELCTAYLERRMGRFERIRFRLHLALCKHCKRYLDQMQLTVDTLGYLPEMEIPPEVHEKLLEHFKDWSKSS